LERIIKEMTLSYGKTRAIHHTAEGPLPFRRRARGGDKIFNTLLRIRGGKVQVAQYKKRWG